jgi:hypothetical protein
MYLRGDGVAEVTPEFPAFLVELRERQWRWVGRERLDLER